LASKPERGGRLERKDSEKRAGGGSPTPWEAKAGGRNRPSVRKEELLSRNQPGKRKKLGGSSWGHKRERKSKAICDNGEINQPKRGGGGGQGTKGRCERKGSGGRGEKRGDGLLTIKTTLTQEKNFLMGKKWEKLPGRKDVYGGEKRGFTRMFSTFPGHCSKKKKKTEDHGRNAVALGKGGRR